MAKPSWVTLSQTEGSGNGTFNISASIHTGREARSGVVTVSGTGVSESKTITVSQAAKTEFVDFSGTATTIAKGGGTVTITGKSNSKTIAFEWVPLSGVSQEYSGDSTDPKDTSSSGNVNYPEINLPSAISINGNSVGALGSGVAESSDYVATTVLTADPNKGLIYKTQVILNKTDPGAAAEYTYSFTITAASNNVMEAISRTLKATCAGGQSSQVTLTQAKGDATLSVSPTTINLVQEGTAQSVTVTSNTTWTVS